jgi:hypothetical protein
VNFTRLSTEDQTYLAKLRADFPAWAFNAVAGRWVGEKHLDDGLIIVEKPDPASLRARIEFYDQPPR